MHANEAACRRCRAASSYSVKCFGCSFITLTMACLHVSRAGSSQHDDWRLAQLQLPATPLAAGGAEDAEALRRQVAALQEQATGVDKRIAATVAMQVPPPPPSSHFCACLRFCTRYFEAVWRSGTTMVCTCSEVLSTGKLTSHLAMPSLASCNMTALPMADRRASVLQSHSNPFRRLCAADFRT